MQIRLQGHRVQLIRTKYNPETKKNESLKTLSFIQGTYPDEQFQAELTDAERHQLKEWLRADNERRKEIHASSFASLGAGYINDVAEAVPHMTTAQATAVWQALDALRAALRRAGHRKPVAKKVVVGKKMAAKKVVAKKAKSASSRKAKAA